MRLEISAIAHHGLTLLLDLLAAKADATARLHRLRQQLKARRVVEAVSADQLIPQFALGLLKVARSRAEARGSVILQHQSGPGHVEDHWGSSPHGDFAFE